MKSGSEHRKDDPSTEEKIMRAARAVFHRKGFAAARTRDIAEEAGINLALLNYYFRSKEKLFDLIMMEALSGFISIIGGIVNDRETSIAEKAELLAKKYTEVLLGNPNLPFFILSEIRQNPEKFISNTKLDQAIRDSYFNQQLRERLQSESKSFHIFISLIGMIVFPFIASPLFRQMGNIPEEHYRQLMRQRAELVPVWFEAMLATE
jgi:AcrR family transcriptional regulator